MLLETYRPSPTKREILPQRDKEPVVNSIFDYYSIENEIDFLRRADIPPQEQRFYIQENVLRFLGEFAGQVPYTKISYLWKPTGMEYGGIDIQGSYRRAADMAGAGSREDDELQGYHAVEQAFQEGARSVAWISPPKVADYSFVFYFEKNPEGNRVDEYILRYKEPRGQVYRSREVLKALDASQSYGSASEFLRNPVASHHSHLDMAQYAVGIDAKKIMKSREFEEAIEDQLSPWIDTYFNLVLVGDVEGARLQLTAIYNRACAIQKTPQNLHFSLQNDHVGNENMLFDYYANQNARVAGGGSCPVTKSSKGGFLSAGNIMEALTLGISPNSLAEGNYFECPKCEGKIPSGEGRTSCPHCGLTKEEHAKASGVECD